MEKMTFVVLDCDDIIDESRGSRINKNGVDTSRFEKNPVMYYMHDREKGVIGRWDNLRLSGNQFVADAVFDESDPLGAEVKRKVEGGFIRGASVSVDNCRYNRDFSVIESCILVEISIVDIPASEHAVIIAPDNSSESLSLQFSLKKVKANNEEKSLRENIIEMLGLPDEATDEDILKNLRERLKSDTSEEVEELYRMGAVSESEIKNLRLLGDIEKKAFKHIVNEKKQLFKDAVRSMVENAVKAGKIPSKAASEFISIGESVGAGKLCFILAHLSGPLRPIQVIKDAQSKGSWGLREYRLYAPEKLEEDPELYNRLLKREFGGIEPERMDDLDYLRKNRPDYLKSHPETYNRLVKQLK